MRVVLLAAVASEAGYLLLNRLGDFRRFVVEYIAVYLLLYIFYLLVCWRVEREKRFSARAVILGGLAFRFTLAALYPTLTEDPHRYRFEGKLLAAGGNPYTERPEDPRWAGLRDTTWEQVNRKDLPTAYGPLLEWCYRITWEGASRFSSDERVQVRLFKVPFQLMDLATAALLWRWRPEALVVYFWSPLVVTEFWASGHTDSALLFFLVAAVWAAQEARWGLAYGALWGATLIKFWPAFLFPLFWRHGGRAQLAAAWIPAAVLVAWPFRAGLDELRGMLTGFLGGWTNNASLFHLVYAAAGRDFERAKPMVAVLVLAVVGVVIWRKPDLVAGVRAVTVTLLVLGANCFPWYLTWVLPFRPSPALLLWAGLAPLSYHVLMGYGALGEWRETSLFLWLEYVPVYAMLAAGLWHRHSPPEA